MSSGSTGIEDARQASELQTNLFNQYGAAGLPGLKGALGYTRGALGQSGGLPAYVQQAYAGARTGALEQRGSNLSSLQRQIASRGGSQKQGGALLSGLSGAVGTAGDAYTREMAGIRTSQAVAGVEQRNKLLGILAGGAASGTNLSAGFGTLGNQALGLDMGSNPTNGYVMGGLSAGLGLYANLAQQQQNSNLGFNPQLLNPYGTPNSAGNYQAGGGTLDLTTRP